MAVITWRSFLLVKTKRKLYRVDFLRGDRKKPHTHYGGIISIISVAQLFKFVKRVKIKNEVSQMELYYTFVVVHIKTEASVMGDTALPEEERTRLLLASDFSIP